MNEKPIIFSTPMVQALLAGRSLKKIYPQKGEDPLSNSHLLRRLLNGIVVDSETGCWNWVRSRNRYHYGTLTIRGKTRFAHRLSYEIFNGNIPEGKFVLHECDNPSCINPAHLHLGTQFDNMRECYERGRSKVKPAYLHGEKNGQAKLTNGDVANIRKLLALGERQRVIAEIYGITQSQVSNISRGAKWNETNYILR